LEPGTQGPLAARLPSKYSVAATDCTTYMSQDPLAANDRRELDEFWRVQLHQAQERYKATSVFYKQVLQEHPETSETGRVLLTMARNAQIRALADFRRLLVLFTNLTMQDRIPREPGPQDELPDLATISPQDKQLIAVVDDDESVRDSIRALLRSANYEVRIFDSALAFLASDAVAHADCLILDLQMPGMDGFSLQRELVAASCPIPIIFIGARDGAEVRNRAVSAGAVAFFCKPFHACDLLSSIQAALSVKRELNITRGVAAGSSVASEAGQGSKGK